VGILRGLTNSTETTEDFETENPFPPVVVTLKVHEKVSNFEGPLVARQDAKVKPWRTNGVSIVCCKLEERLAAFGLESLGPVTLIQDIPINMPDQSWN
jgi:cancer susceptibility candidate protein 1